MLVELVDVALNGGDAAWLVEKENTDVSKKDRAGTGQ
jgi:hypothetical protein